VALLLVILNVVNTVGEYILGQAVVAQADTRQALDAAFDRQAYVGTFYGHYFLLTNLAAIALQAFVVSRVVRCLGMGTATRSASSRSIRSACCRRSDRTARWPLPPSTKPRQPIRRRPPSSACSRDRGDLRTGQRSAASGFRRSVSDGSSPKNSL
jgi:hypothetical protein